MYILITKHSLRNRINTYLKHSAYTYGEAFSVMKLTLRLNYLFNRRHLQNKQFHIKYLDEDKSNF